MWVCIVLVACSIFTLFRESLLGNSDINWRDVWISIIKIVSFVPMVIIGAVVIAIEKRLWGVIILACVVITMFIVAFLFDPGESPAPWNS